MVQVMLTQPEFQKLGRAIETRFQKRRGAFLSGASVNVNSFFLMISE